MPRSASAAKKKPLYGRKSESGSKHSWTRESSCAEPRRSCIGRRSWPPDSEDTNEENGGENVSPKNNPNTRQPAGDSPAAVLPAISRGELEESEKAVEKLRDLLSLAEKDQENAMPKIRQILGEHPDLAQRFLHLGRMGEDILLGKMAGEDDLATRELFRSQLNAMREEIAGENPSPLERLLAERIVATWLQIQLFEGLYASGMSKRGMTIAKGNL